MSQIMAISKNTNSKIVLVHLVVVVSTLIAIILGISHRSSIANVLFQIPLFVWPIWFFFFGKGRLLRTFSISLGVLFSFLSLAVFGLTLMVSDEVTVYSKKRFDTSLGQFYLVQQNDIDTNVTTRITVEQKLPFGFVKSLNKFDRSGDNDFGEIYETKVGENQVELKGEKGSYLFKLESEQLQLVN